MRGESLLDALLQPNDLRTPPSPTESRATARPPPRRVPMPRVRGGGRLEEGLEAAIEGARGEGRLEKGRADAKAKEKDLGRGQ